MEEYYALSLVSKLQTVAFRDFTFSLNFEEDGDHLFKVEKQNITYPECSVWKHHQEFLFANDIVEIPCLGISTKSKWKTFADFIRSGEKSEVVSMFQMMAREIVKHFDMGEPVTKVTSTYNNIPGIYIFIKVGRSTTGDSMNT